MFVKDVSQQHLVYNLNRSVGCNDIAVNQPRVLDENLTSTYPNLDLLLAQGHQGHEGQGRRQLGRRHDVLLEQGHQGLRVVEQLLHGLPRQLVERVVRRREDGERPRRVQGRGEVGRLDRVREHPEPVVLGEDVDDTTGRDRVDNLVNEMNNPILKLKKTREIGSNQNNDFCLLWPSGPSNPG